MIIKLNDGNTAKFVPKKIPAVKLGFYKGLRVFSSM